MFEKYADISRHAVNKIFGKDEVLNPNENEDLVKIENNFRVTKTKK